MVDKNPVARVETEHEAKSQEPTGTQSSGPEPSSHDALKHDLAVLEAIASGLPAYLASDVTWWDMGRSGMPLLTIGGYLMRRRRLAALSHLLLASEIEAMTAINVTFDDVVAHEVVHFEDRAQAEIGSRLREWTVYLRDLAVSHRLAADTARYGFLADTRVVIEELVAKLGARPFHLPDHVPADVAKLDKRLKSRWTPGPFIWAPIWTPAYPPTAYWWLYGHPKTD